MNVVRYRIEYTAAASKSLAKLPTTIAIRIKATIDALADDPHPQGSIKLTGSNSYRVRVGDYRIIYTVYNQRLLVEIVRIGHRSDIYHKK